MKKVIVLMLVVLAGLFVFAACGDDSNSDCDAYCDKTKECDETGTLTEEWLSACKTACDEAADQVDDSILACANEASCDDFATCLAGGSDTEE